MGSRSLISANYSLFSTTDNNRHAKVCFKFDIIQYETNLNVFVQIAIIGAGAGGISVSSQLINSGKVKASDITVIDPQETHYYQPSFTMIGGGVIGNA